MRFLKKKSPLTHHRMHAVPNSFFLDKSHTKNSEVLLSLSGGLGNQLFQYLSVKAIANDRKLILTDYLGYPRKNPNNLPDLLDLNVIDQSNFRQVTTAPYVFQKLSNFSLRKSNNNNRYFWKTIVASINIGLSLLFFRPSRRIHYSAPFGIGFDPNFKLPDASCFVVGYFQTYKWFQEQLSEKELSEIGPRTETTWLKSFIELSRVEKPIIVHVRLGDYKNEKFGICSPKYFSKALEYLGAETSDRKIWLFSNDSENALAFIPDYLHRNVRTIESDGELPASILECMRYGSSYVISNSTFAWWAAYLRKDREATVICPERWFENVHVPRDLIPPAWVRLECWEN